MTGQVGPDGRQLLFSTPHGSHLYGLATATSDRDTYEVYTSVPHARAGWAHQSIDGAHDTFRIEFGTWLTQCHAGVPQALEAMFSPMPTYDAIGPFRAGFRVGTHVIPTFLRTIRHFAAAGDLKRRRHALRLGLNARDVLRYGRYSPVMNHAEVAWATRVAERLHGDEAAGVAEASIFY